MFLHKLKSAISFDLSVHLYAGMGKQGMGRRKVSAAPEDWTNVPFGGTFLPNLLYWTLLCSGQFLQFILCQGQDAAQW